MARKQTRRCVSLKEATYQKVRSFCENNGVSMSGFVEERIAEYFLPAEDDKYPGSDQLKEAPRPVKKTKIREGGIHEF